MRRPLKVSIKDLVMRSSSFQIHPNGLSTEQNLFCKIIHESIAKRIISEKKDRAD